MSNHASSTRAETRYRIRVACRTGGVAHIRALLIQALNGGPLVLRALQAETRTPGGPAALDALLVGPARDDALVERIVVRLSLESLVSAVRWDVVEDDDQEPTEVANAEIDERLALIGKEVTT